MAKGRRFLGNVPQLTRRGWEDAAPELERFLHRLFDSEADGIPPGFNNLTPAGLEPDQLPSPGTENTGWAASDHIHATYADTAVDLGDANAEGTSTLFARADHVHKRSIIVEDDLTSLGSVQIINANGGIDAAVLPNVALGLVGAWKMEEASGTRADVLGVHNLFEPHGVVNGEAGLIGNAARPVIDALDRDYRSYGEWLRGPAYVGWYPLGPGPAGAPAPGVAINGTVAILFKPETGLTTTGGATIGGLVSYNSFPYPVIGTAIGWDGAQFVVYSATTVVASVVVHTGTGGGIPCTLDAWHVVIAWFDSTTSTIYCQLDGGSVDSQVSPTTDVEYGNFTYWMTGPRFKGLIDTGAVWNRVLTSQERDLVTATLLAGVDPDFLDPRPRATLSSTYRRWSSMFGG